MDNELQHASNGLLNAEDKALRFIKVFMPYLVLLVSVAFTIVKSLFSFGLTNPFCAEFWINLGTNITTTFATYTVFCVHGNDNFKSSNKPFADNLKLWGEYSQKIRNESPIEFIEYCREYAKKCAESKRRAKFEKRTLIPWADFNEKYAVLSDEAIKGMYLSNQLNKSDYKAILTAKKAVKPPHISATALLCGSESVSVENIGAAKRNYVAQAIALRPFVMLCTSAGLAIISPIFTGISGATVLFSIVSSIFLILIAAASGNTAGVNGARREAADIKSRIYFLDTYKQFSKKALTNSTENANI